MTEGIIPPSNEQFEAAGQDFINHMKDFETFMNYLSDPSSDSTDAFEALMNSLDANSKEKVDRELGKLLLWDDLPDGEEPTEEELYEAVEKTLRILLRLDNE